MANWILFGILLVQVCGYFLQNPGCITLTHPLRYILHCIRKGPPHSQVDGLCAALAWDYSDGGTHTRHNPTSHHSIYQPRCNQWNWNKMDFHPTVDRTEYVHIWSCWLRAPTDQVGLVLYQLIVASITQGFYCYRVGVLTRSKCAVAVIGMVRIIRKYH